MGQVDIGYYFKETVYNEFTDEWEEQDRFVVVKPVAVSAIAPVGIYGG